MLRRVFIVAAGGVDCRRCLRDACLQHSGWQLVQWEVAVIWARAAVATWGLAGAAAVCYGLFLWWEPAAWVFGGCYAIVDASRWMFRQRPQG